MNNIIFCAYAQNEKKQSGNNVKDVKDRQNLYYQNAVVALISAKQYNPECDVALVTNVTVPQKYYQMLDQKDIQIIYEDFDEFTFDDNFEWGLAFYKLCALKKLLRRNYESYLLLDTDTYIQSSLKDLWDETEENILLYDINHRLSNTNCAEFNKEVEMFTNEKKNLVNFGGEFIAGSHKLLNIFINELDNIYNQMKKEKFITKFGDEFLIRLAAYRLKNIIKNASGYIYRFWTGSFYLTSTCYYFNPVSVLHVPREKKYGMLKIYRYLERTGYLPSNKKIYTILHLKKPSYLVRIKILLKKFI